MTRSRPVTLRGEISMSLSRRELIAAAFTAAVGSAVPQKVRCRQTLSTQFFVK